MEEHREAVLPPQLKTYRDQFLALKEEARALTEDLSPEAFNRSPAPGQWSVGQCLDHLNEAGHQLVPRLEAALREAALREAALREAALREARAAGRFARKPFRYGWLERLFIRLNGPDPPFKLPAPAAYRPAQGALDPARTTASFLALQDRLVACVEDAEGLDLRRVKIASPASRWVRLGLGAWLAATAAHEARHLKQAFLSLQ